MAWPITTAATSNNANTASVTVLATSSTVSLTAGDVILALRKWEGADTTCAVSDTENTYTQFTTDHGGAAEPWVSLSWAVAATTASRTITSTLGAARTFNDLVVAVLRRDAAGTVTMDGTAIAASGSGTALNSGNMTTSTQETNGSLQIGYSGDYGTDPTSELCFGTAADVVVQGGISNQTEIWTRRTTNGATGAASATESSNTWVCGVAALKTVAAVAFLARKPFVLMQAVNRAGTY